MALITPADACYQLANNAGFGLATSWVLSGQSDVYSGTLTDVDGYMITAHMTWRDLNPVTQTSVAANDIPATSNAVIGTCVETLDADGVSLAAAVTTEGNYALCHWMYYVGRSGTTILGQTTDVSMGGTSGTDWGETRFLTETEWGTGGSHILGSNIRTNGSSVGATYGMALSHTSLTNFIPTAVYSMSWYQPKYASTYSATSLRRYSGGDNEGSKVKAYCVGPRTITDANIATDITPADDAGLSGVVTLQGASALTAGAIAFGVAALAF